MWMFVEGAAPFQTANIPDWVNDWVGASLRPMR
jgi:hypothetical protein